MQEQELIAVRIKDGIFAGNVTAASDREFLGMNKITHIINCAGGEVADFFVGDPELKYLSFPWKDPAGAVCTTVLFDSGDDTVIKTIHFIDEAIEQGDCVLVHSYFGVSRSPALIAAYFIVKYGWKLESALAFLEMAHPDAAIKPHFLRQLRLFAKRHQVDHDIFDKVVDDTQFGLDNDQWMLRNTLLNGLAYEEQQANDLYHQCTGKVDLGTRVSTKDAKKKTHISFIDTNQGPDVEPATGTPVVNVKPVHHIDPNANNDTPTFVGSQGPVALHSGHRSPSIMSRSTSPCVRRLESDPRSCPKGRQDLPIVKTQIQSTSASSAGGTKVSVERASSAVPATVPSVMRTASSASGVASEDKPGGSTRQVSQPKTKDYKRLAPPVAPRAPHSTFAQLTSSHKYRNGSPLPLTKGQNKTPKKVGVTKISSSPSGRAPGGTGSAVNSPRLPSSPGRTPSPSGGVGGVRPSIASSGGVSRGLASSYKGIAPQRSSFSSKPAWNSPKAVEDDRPSVTRPLSPSFRNLSPANRTGSARPRNSSPGARPIQPRSPSGGKRKASPRATSPRTSVTKGPDNSSFSDTGSLKKSSISRASPKPTGTAAGQIRRQPPTAIASRRLDSSSK